MASILTALINLADKKDNSIRHVVSSGNVVNAMGDSLDAYIKSLFIDNIDNMTPEEINLKKQEIFSWLGNQNNIPDLILKNGDAVEVKKIEAVGSLALNSSHPKQVLSSESSMISQGCRDCEGLNTSWTKELWYVIGTVDKNKIIYLFFIHGVLYSADESIYAKIRTDIKNGIEEISDIQFSNTNELAKVHCIDPLGITSLRVRGMWAIKHPFNVYDYIPEIKKHHNNLNDKLYTYILVENNKYFSFSENERKTLESKQNVKTYDKQIKNPNNPAQLIESKLIKIEI
jgi:hypothetical protein